MKCVKKLLPGVGCVLLVASTLVAPYGRYAQAAEPETCTDQGCVIPPVVATGLPPVRGFENQTATQAPQGDRNDVPQVWRP